MKNKTASMELNREDVDNLLIALTNRIMKCEERIDAGWEGLYWHDEKRDAMALCDRLEALRSSLE